MRLDWEIAKRGWRRYAAYPWATAAGVFTNTIFGFIQAYILLAVFHNRAQVGTYDAADAVTYVWLAQALIMTVYAFGWRSSRSASATARSRPTSHGRSTRSATGSPSTSAARRTTCSSAASLRSWSARSSSTCTTRSPLDLVAFFVSRRARGGRQPRLPLPLQLGRVLARRLPRVVMLSLIRLALLLGVIMPLDFFPDWLRHDRSRAAVRRDRADAGRHLARQAPRPGARRRPRAAGRCGRSSCSVSAGSRCGAARGSW